MPHTHTWTRKQRWLIAASVLAVVGVFATVAYIYERYYRGPGEEVLYGTWEAVDFIDGDSIYFRFRPDQTFTAGGLFEGELNPFSRGRWYAGGPNIYIRFSADDMQRPQQVIVFHIVDIKPNEVHVRLLRDGQVYTFRRATLKSTSASNHAVERTATRFVSTRRLATILPTFSTLPSVAVAHLCLVRCSERAP
jgi:hypothetical protein